MPQRVYLAPIHPFFSHGDNVSCRLTMLLLENGVGYVLRNSAAAPPMPKATNAHNLHTVDVTHVVYACFTSTAQSIEGGSGEVTLHQLASHLSFHLLPGWRPPPPDRDHEARGLLENLL
jgi:hypothetical protein